MTREEKEVLLIETLKEVDRKNMPRLKQMKEALDRVYGKDFNQIIKKDIRPAVDWDMSKREFVTQLTNLLKGEYYYVDIHVPEVTISNTQRKRHLIRDIYVRVKFNGDLKFVGNLHGMRTTFTSFEWASSYTHSHLSGRATAWSRFCTGTGPINQVTILLGQNFDAVEFEMLLQHIKVFLAHESIEGTPYCCIGNMAGENPAANLVTNSVSAQSDLDQIYKQVFRDFSNDRLKRQLKITLTDTGVQVEATEDFEKRLVEIIQHIGDTTGFRYFNWQFLRVYKKANGTYTETRVGDSIPADLNTRAPLITFKGQERRLQIINASGEINTEYYAHPDITKYICNRLSKELTTLSFRAAQDAAQGQNSSVTAPAETNLLAV